MTMRLITDEQHAQIVAQLNSVEPECGYGYYRPANPHNFQPDYECCSPEEIAAHKAACDAYTRGEYTPEKGDGWVSPDLHILRAPWGIGTYQIAPQGIEEALAILQSAPEVEVVGKVETCATHYEAKRHSVLSFTDKPIPLDKPLYATKEPS